MYLCTFTCTVCIHSIICTHVHYITTNLITSPEWMTHDINNWTPININSIVYLSIHSLIHPSFRPSVCLSINLFIHPSIHPSICLSIRPSIHLTIYPSACIYLSIHFSVSNCNVNSQTSNSVQYENRNFPLK